MNCAIKIVFILLVLLVFYAIFGVFINSRNKVAVTKDFAYKEWSLEGAEQRRPALINKDFDMKAQSNAIGLALIE